MPRATSAGAFHPRADSRRREGKFPSARRATPLRSLSSSWRPVDHRVRANTSRQTASCREIRVTRAFWNMGMSSPR